MIKIHAVKVAPIDTHMHKCNKKMVCSYRLAVKTNREAIKSHFSLSRIFFQNQGMSIWARTQQLPQDKLKHVSNLYESSQIPIEVRHYFAEWIEEQPW